MKYIHIIFLAFLLVTAQTGISYGSEYAAALEKKVNARYAVQAGDKIAIDNIYGMVHVNTWDRNEVTIDITVSVKAVTGEKAEEILDRVSFKQEGGHRIYYKTIVAPPRSNNSVGPTIDYVVNMPKKMALDLTNKYGDVYLDDVEGGIELALSYGALSAKNIYGNDNHIKVAYGNGVINSMDAGKMDISYSNFNIENAKNLDVKNIFGKLNISSIQRLDIAQKYDALNLGTVANVAGNIDYADIVIDKLTASATLNLKYCSKTEFKSIEASVQQVKINTSYGSLSLHLAPSADFTIDAEAMYGQITGTSMMDMKESGRTNFTVDYKGKTGSGKGIMQLSAKYGNIKFK